jgi:hypothetical protein
VSVAEDLVDDRVAGGDELAVGNVRHVVRGVGELLDLDENDAIRKGQRRCQSIWSSAHGSR